MATPIYATVLSQINTYIVANGNNEITANVLNPILKLMLDFANNNIGDLDTLTTDEKNSIVEAINSLKQNFDDLVNNGVQLYTGIDNPNDTPPPSYKYADFYMQVDIDSLPVKLWQWNGFEWTDESGEPATESDNVINNSDVDGVTVTDALEYLNTEKADDGNVIHTTGNETKSDILNMTDKIQFGTVKTTYGKAIGVSKTLTAMNVHIIDDYSVLNSTTSPAQGFGTFDASTEMTGTANYDHFQAYQSRLNYTGSGDITGSYGLAGLFVGNGHNGTGTIGSSFGIHIFDIEGTGDVNYSAGITIEPITRGTVENWAIDSGGGDFRFRGNVLNLNGKGYYSFSVGDPLATNQKSVSFVSDSNSSFYSIGTGSQTPGNFVFYSYDGGPVVERLNINATTGVIKIPNLSGTGTRQVVADASGNLSATSADSRPYKAYVAIFNQSGTSAPTSTTIFENGLGGAIVWSRTSIGTYVGTLTGAFTSGKVIGFLTNTAVNSSTPINMKISSSSVNTIDVMSYVNGALADNAISNMSLEIRVYN